ncbi:MAG TPA: DNA-directed RNA polymerase subunit N [Geobacterales bacterium]|nr:DNA-directed RNA polymerase subunit N [Geobacterales bacterium]
MLVPIRCFTCGYPISRFWDEYKRRVQAGEDPASVLDRLGIKRYCCRRMFLSTYEYMDDLMIYFKGEDVKKSDETSYLDENDLKKSKRRKEV